MKRLLTLSLTLAVTASSIAQAPLAVPLSVMRENVPAPVQTASKNANVQTQQQGSSASTLVNSESRVVLEPGKNVIIPVAVGHLNRLVTPFSRPNVKTVDRNVSYQVESNVIYVAPPVADQPVTMFIRETGNESLAMSVTLWPQQRPAREVELTFGGQFGGMGIVYERPTAERWERSMPYIEMIKQLFTKIAMQEVPTGYQVSRMTGADMDTITCAQNGLMYNFADGQIIDGNSLRVLVGRVWNVSNQPIEVREESCANWRTAAITQWPYALLEPGQATEVYVALKDNKQPAVQRRRPSLLGGGQ